MPNLQTAGREREAKRSAAEAAQLPNLKEALAKRSYKELASEETCFAALSKDFKDVGRNAFHDAWLIALDAADVAEQQAKKEQAKKEKTKETSGSEARPTHTAGGQGTRSTAIGSSGEGSPAPQPPAAV